MKKLILGMAVFSLLVSSLSAKNENKALKRAIEEGSLQKVEQALELYKKIDIPQTEREKQLDELVTMAQELATKAPEGQLGRLKSWLIKAAKLSGGMFLLGTSFHISFASSLRRLETLEKNNRGEELSVYPIFIAGLTVSTGLAGLGAWLFNKGMTDSTEPVVTTDAQAIFEFLEEALDSL